MAGDPAAWRVKGVAIKATLSFIRENHGEPAEAEVLAALPPGIAKQLGKQVLVSSWYPGQVFVELTRVADHHLRYSGSFASTVGEASADYALGESGPYSIFRHKGLRHGVGRFLESGAGLWELYYDVGSFGVQKTSPGKVQVGIQQGHLFHPTVLDRVAAFVKRGIELIGAQQVRVHWIQIADGVRMDVEWKE